MAKTEGIRAPGEIPASSLEGSAAGVLLGSGVAIASALGVRVAMARFLAPDDLGAVLLAIAVTSFAGIVASCGLRSASARRIAERLALGRSEEAESAARTAIGAALATGLAAGLLIPFLPRLGLGRLGELSSSVIAGTAPAALGLSLGMAMWGISQGRGDTRGRALFRDAGGSALRLAGVVAAAGLLSGAPARFALGWGVGSLLGDLSFVAYGTRRGWLRRSLPASARIDRGLLRSLPPFLGLTLINQAATWLDIVLLGALAPLAAVGVYGAAQGLGRVLGQVSDSASHRFLPLASAAVAARDEAGLAAGYRRSRQLAFAYLWPILGPCLLCPQALVRVAFGAHYEVAGSALRWLAAGWLARSVAGYTEEALVARGRASQVFAITLGSTLATAALFFLWVPRQGALGAAIAVAAGQALRGAAGIARFDRPLRRAVLAPVDFARLLGAAAPALAVALGFAAWPTPLPPWLVLGGVVIAALSAALGPAAVALRAVLSGARRRRTGRPEDRPV
ncbi:MAG TPA: lipopolysaccharide biosynthesis protein [Thermoanaerobaculia bacterium]|jgi:O-antigen/teichoic acid export membrane protein|nr:lipopolysaccharide biosynthesis protein [Thermoanaerobaculia bacterium]